MGFKDSAMRDIDGAFFEVSEELAKEELGNRRRSVWYRSRLKRVNSNLDLGVPGDYDQPWVKLWPTPYTGDVHRDFVSNQIGTIVKGDLEMRVDRLSIPRETLQKSEYFIDDDPDSPEPTSDEKPNYDLIGGYVLEGGSGTRGAHPSFWIAYLRRKQLNIKPALDD